MRAFAKGIPWLAIALCFSRLTGYSCSEEEALLLDDKDFCTVPGAADVKACDWIVEQLEDQNPDLTYDFFCSKEEDCDSDSIEGEVVDWFSGGCNGPKIINKLCGCCVFIQNVAPGVPTNLAASEVTASSATITWSDGSMGFPEETYTVRCFEGEMEDCKSTDFAGEVTGIRRGAQEGTVGGLDPETFYNCFVLAINPVVPTGVCSDSFGVTTAPLPSFKLTIGLQVDTCDAFDEVAVIEAFCEALIEEAGFPEETTCLTEESECAASSVDGRRRLNENGLEATITFAGNFGGQTEEEVKEDADAVLQDQERLQDVQGRAVELLAARGTEDFADFLNGTSITGGTSRVEDAEPECATRDQCQAISTSPVCVSNFCVACGSIERPAIQGNCQVEEFCRLNGSCSEDQCDLDTDCRGLLPICDSGNCVACTPQSIPAIQGNCPDGEFCRADGSCSNDQCKTDAECGGTQPICEESSCVACTPQTFPAIQGNCPDGEFCRADGGCADTQCTSSDDCGGDFPSCDPDTNTCKPLFYLAENGITVRCPDASEGDTGEVDGITFTKRTRADILPANAANTCTSGITDMNCLISPFCSGVQGWQSFNGDISSWDTSLVTDMSFMFRGADNFNQNIGNWDKSKVTTFNNMFVNAGTFNQPIGGWNTSQITSMNTMFSSAIAFNQELKDWDTSKVALMDRLFSSAQSFDQDISSWCVELIPSKPFRFDLDSGFSGQTALQPQWGEVCKL